MFYDHFSAHSLLAKLCSFFGCGGLIVRGALSTIVDQGSLGPQWSWLYRHNEGLSPPWAHIHGFENNFILQDNNNPCLRFRIDKYCGSDNDIKTLQCPSQSPTLNHIENLWSQPVLALNSAPMQLRTVKDSCVFD